MKRERTRRLLVVIAIIAILAALLFPVFAQARKRARQMACLNNMKQIDTGLYIYLGDWDDTYPMMYFPIQPGVLGPAGTNNVGSTCSWRRA